MLTRPVVQDFYKHGAPWPGAEVRYTLRTLGYTTTLMYPPVTVTVTADENGHTAVNLWPNAESMARTEYTATLPDGTTVDFVLPVGESEITLIALIMQARVPHPWYVPGINEYIDLRLDAEAALRIAGDAAVYDVLANTSDPLLGDAKIGTRAMVPAATGRTVHSKLTEILSVFDVIPETEHAAIQDRTSTYDCGPALAALIAYAETNAKIGILINFPAGKYQFSTPLVITNVTGMIWKGAGGRYNVNYRDSGTTLEFTGTGAVDAIKVNTNFARNFQMRDLALAYSSPLFTGNLLNLGETLLAACSFTNVYFGGPGLSAGTALYTANACVKSNSAEFYTFHNCYFSEAQFGYLGGTVQQAGISFYDCVFGDLAVAQVRSIAITGLSWRFIGCNFDPIRITPQYGVDLACNGFLLLDCHAVGVSTTVAPTEIFYRLSGRGAVRGGFISTARTGIKFVAGGVYTLGDGIRIQAASPVIVHGGLFIENGVDYVFLSTGAGVHLITRTAGGSGYTAATATITPAVGDTTGTGATATVSVSGGAVATVTVTNRGSNYTLPPDVTISGDGTGATATASIGNAAVDLVPGGTGADGDLTPTALQTATLRLGPSRFSRSGAALAGYSYRSNFKSSFINGWMDYSSQDDASGLGMALFIGSAQYIQVRRLGQSNVETLVFELTVPMGTGEVVIGTVPAGSIIDEIWVNTEAAFNSGTSDTLSIGISGVSSGHFIVSHNVHATGLTKITSANIPSFKAADSIITVQRTAVGATATLGRAQIIVRYQAIT